MHEDTDRPGDIQLRDWIAYIHEKLGHEQWVTVYRSSRGDWGAVCFFCALVPNSMVGKVLNNESWDLRIGQAGPRCSITRDAEGARTVTYHRFGNDDGIEPLIHWRGFHGVKRDYVEVSEEFRLFHNLYQEKPGNKLVKINEDGTEDDIVLVEEDRVRIKVRPLRQFLAIREMHLAIFFSIERYSEKTLEQLGLKEDRQTVKQVNMVYRFFVGERESLLTNGKPTLSGLHGKKLIPGVPKEKSGAWPYEESEKDYEDFIIGVDDKGDPISHTCDPDALSNYFGKNPHAPHYLTPVFFRRDVLAKYYSKPGTFSVEDGYLRCGGLWSLRIDNNHEKYVIVFLGDLGRDLPAGERRYWRSYNVPPDSTISDVTFKRSFLGEFADPDKADLVFKSRWNIFQEKWLKRYEWLLWKPLSEDDRHNFKALRVPLSDDQAEFDGQVMALAKVLIDSLNEQEIGARIKRSVPKDAKGITKLSLWLRDEELADSEQWIKFLRSLQALRNGSGHRKGEDYRRAAAYFRLEEMPLSAAFEGILKQATEFLKHLDAGLLTKETPEGQDIRAGLPGAD